MKLRTKKSLKHLKKVALSLVFLMIYQMVFPIVAWALTSGPTQPEVQSFEPVGTTEMVDLFSGDFTYNIPLFEVPGPDGGYPVNLFYNSVTSGEAEATMVGLGWNIGIGAINRQMQGLPDDFNGEEITKTQDTKPNRTFGVTPKVGFEFFGADKDKVKKVKKTVDDQGGGLGSLQLSGTLMYNSYKGWGYSIDPTLSVNMASKNPESKLKFGGNFGFSMSSFDGASTNAGFSISDKDEETNKELRFGIGLSSRGANNLSFGVSGSQAASLLSSYIQGNFIGRESPSYTPQISMAQTGKNISLGAGSGVGVYGGYINYDVTGFYSEQKLVNRNEPFKQPVYGYLHGDKAPNNGLLDFNREKEITILENSPNLPIPVTTPDLLSVVGHGIGGMYRPYRSDVGIYFDHEVESVSGGGTVNFDLDVVTGAGKFGVDLNGNYSISKTERLDLLTFGGDLGFQGFKVNSDYEPFYYKSPGELTSEAKDVSDNIGNDGPIRLEIQGVVYNDFNFYDHDHYVKRVNGKEERFKAGGVQRKERKPRNSSIQPITNEDLLNGSSNEILPTYDIAYYNISNSTVNGPSSYQGLTKTSLNRTAHAPSQFAGYTTVTANGSIWNFALPVKNKVQKDVVFSVAEDGSCKPILDDIDFTGDAINYRKNDTDEYLDITEIPEYTHSYMLTSVVGSDYVDVDPNDGEPNEKDRGYWMIVDYVKVTDNNAPYKWRAPFSGANYNKGYNSKTTDDKGSFSYGEREVYLPATIRTKTHIAEFIYSRRNDGRGAYSWLQDKNTNQHGAYSQKLDQIKLYSIEEIENPTNPNGVPTPIKVVHFDYDYSLCPNVDNNAAGGGKLTLKQVWFTYENSNRGALSPYKFEYPEQKNDITKPDYTGYDIFQFDSWGARKPKLTDDYCLNIEEPYVDQTLTDAQQAANISAWHISKIILPSGAEINIDIGRDHYGYVQDRVAAQMFKVTGTEANGSTFMKDENTTTTYKLYFDLENGNTDIDAYFENLYEDNNGKQLYFKTRIQLLGQDDPGGKTYEDISGYAYIQDYGITNNKGWVNLRPMQIEGDNYHPIVLQARQFIKTNLPHMMYGYEPDAPASFNDMVKKFFSVAANAREVIGAFRDYYNVCRSRNYGQELDLSRSYIRLNTPDKLKYGDGVRVNRVTMNDGWEVETGEAVPDYGMVYDYTAEDGSSYGVATNEPAASKDESALRYMKRYREHLDHQKDNWLFFDYPINESYYPGASVGYSQVTVKSLATDASIKKAKNNTPLPSYLQGLDGFATSGVTIHKFYTAKDYPIITNETMIDTDVNPRGLRFIPIPFIGQISMDYYAGSQGYSIELNNMHGKPYEVINYPQDANGNIVDEAISWVKYEYEDEESFYTPNKFMNPWKRRVLKNIVKVLENDAADMDMLNADIEEEAEMGVEREFFADVRASSSQSYTGGLDFNVDFAAPFIIPMGWPELGASETKVRTAVTNKIIRKTGILKKVTAYDGQAKVVTENLVYDKLTGQPVLTRVNNNYDDAIYSYNIPAYLVYDGMGAAYENWGLKFDGKTNTTPICNGLYQVNNINVNIKTKLIEGDEFIVEQNSVPLTRATLVHKMTSNLYFKIENVNVLTNNGIQEFHLIRSGKRNHLSASAGSIVALNQDPTKNRTKQIVNYNVRETNGPNVTTVSKSFTTYKVNNVLSANVVTYKNSWIEGHGSVGEGNIVTIPTNGLYNIVAQGIWRPDNAYAYVTDRNQTSGVDLQTEGTYTYTMFNWKKAQDMELAIPEWRNTNRITRYGTNGAELENRNILGQYSAALYGYNDNLATAVAVNARYSEIGYEGFEEHPMGPITNTGIASTGQIDFGYDQTVTHKANQVSETFHIKGYVRGNATKIILDEKVANSAILPKSTVVLNLRDDNGKYYIAKGLIEEQGGVNATTDGYVELTLKSPINSDCGAIIENTAELTGDIKIFYQKNYGNNASNSGIIEYGIAHTGKKMLRFNASAILPQTKLHLNPNKKYVFSAWVLVENGNNNATQFTYDDGNTFIKVGNNVLKPSGPIIDYWQKIEGTFQISTTGGYVFNIVVNVPSGGNMLIDDIRIFPEDGNIQTYVYDPISYRVTEVLDNNNFYTRYEYDEEGNLIILKKETIKGVKTLQESRSHIKSN